MLRKLQIQEKATEKLLEIDPMSMGVMLFFRNVALNERIHIELYLEDMKAVVALLQNRIEEVETECEPSTYDLLREHFKKE